ncbi:hypothetical protein GCM10023168_04950 [Fodinibacter luteus]|uniref:Uncharacterized protein n=1 Tax=Fodinibacter luteus TaxID=552064 RepID=A0ABP8K027_9MICO
MHLVLAPQEQGLLLDDLREQGRALGGVPGQVLGAKGGAKGGSQGGWRVPGRWRGPCARRPIPGTIDHPVTVDPACRRPGAVAHRP